MPYVSDLCCSECVVMTCVFSLCVLCGHFTSQVEAGLGPFGGGVLFHPALGRNIALQGGAWQGSGGNTELPREKGRGGARGGVHVLSG